MCDASAAEKIVSCPLLKDFLACTFPSQKAEAKHTDLSETKEAPATTTHKPSYSVAYKGRSNIGLHREDLQKVCKELIGQGARIDYKQPEYVISVEVIKTVCAISVIKNEDYVKTKKFNTRIYIKG